LFERDDPVVERYLSGLTLCNLLLKFQIFCRQCG
jgi:hypothetical protein